jgi:hypothetical protein
MDCVSEPSSLFSVLLSEVALSIATGVLYME